MRDFREQNCYELLDVKPYASQQELEGAYNRARRFFSSESVATYALFQPDELVLLRRRIEDAYRILSDPERRQRYDSEMLRLEEEGLQGSELETSPERSAGTTDEVHEEKEQATQDSRQLKLDEVADQEPLEQEQPVEEEPEDRPSDSTPVDEKTGESDDRLSGEGKSEDVQPSGSSPVQTTEPEPKDDMPVLPPMPPINEETEYSGDLLRQVREARGFTIEKIADITKIAIYYVRNLESEKYSDLPARVYVRGYIKQIAKLLEIDIEATAKSYVERMEKPDEPDEAV
ncbi:MAG: helix-turn-helix domain-containing protein [Deltaproteobacteria bacterium]|nr:helix-turn-helix domain-containing protein [Deltaproteobacteria bacterium]